MKKINCVCAHLTKTCICTNLDENQINLVQTSLQAVGTKITVCVSTRFVPLQCKTLVRWFENQRELDVAPLPQLDASVCGVHPWEGNTARPRPRPRSRLPCARTRLPLARQPFFCITHTQQLAHARATAAHAPAIQWHASRVCVAGDCATYSHADLCEAYFRAWSITCQLPRRWSTILSQVVEHADVRRFQRHAGAVAQLSACRILVESGPRCTSHPNVRKLAMLHAAA
jgi:hypothetical protein